MYQIYGGQIMEDKLLNVNDVMELTGVKKNKAYDLIKLCNDEIKNKDYITLSWKVPKSYFKKD